MKVFKDILLLATTPKRFQRSNVPRDWFRQSFGYCAWPPDRSTLFSFCSGLLVSPNGEEHTITCGIKSTFGGCGGFFSRMVGLMKGRLENALKMENVQ